MVMRRDGAEWWEKDGEGRGGEGRAFKAEAQPPEKLQEGRLGVH